MTVEVGNYLNVGEFQRSPQRTGHDDRVTPSDEPLEALENRHPEEPMLRPAVASGTVEGGVAEAVPAAPDDEQKITWRRLIT